MRIDKRVKEIEWPPKFESEKYDLYITLDWPMINHEQLLVATFVRNEKWYCWDRGRNFRLVCSKMRNTAAILYKGARSGQRIPLRKAISDLGYYPTNITPKIAKEDEKSLISWLGLKKKQGTQHGIPALCEWVDQAMAEETQKERDARGELRDEDVRLCPQELPDGLIGYIQRCVLPYDDVLIYRKGNVRGTCFLCRQEVRAKKERFLQGMKVRCPNCGAEVYTLLNTSDRFRVDYVEDIVTVQKGSDEETVFLRQWHLKRDFTAQWQNIPAYLEEICRYAIRGNRVAKWQREAKSGWYGTSMRYELSDWTRVQSVSVVYDGAYYFYLPNNWRQIFEGTSLRYCPVDEYAIQLRNIYCRCNTIRFLMDWVRYPAIEKFWKAGYKEAVAERIWGLNKDTQHTIRWSQSSIQSALRFPARLLKIHKPEEWTMGDLAKVTGLWKQVEAGDLSEKDLPEMAVSMATLDDIRNAIGHASVHRILNYVGKCVEQEREQRRIKADKAKKEGRYYYGGGAFNSPKTYRDYLSDCIKLNLNLDDKSVLFPADLDAAHARTIAQVKHKANELSREAFLREVKRLSWMEWEKDGLLIRLPVDGDELTAEGAYLHHCVGGYVDRMANGKTTILLIRKKEEPDKPFYTLEWLNGRVQQCRTTHNRNYLEDKEVKDFVDKWVKKVTNRSKKKKKAASAA